MEQGAMVCKRQMILSRRARWAVWLFLCLAVIASLWGATPAAAQEPVIICQDAVDVLPRTENDIFFSAEPTLSEDGNQIIFWSTGNFAGANNQDGNIEIFRVQINPTSPLVGRQFTQLTTSTGSILGGFNLSPALSESGRYVVFFSDRNPQGINQNSDGNFEIFRYDTVANTLSQITQTTRGSNLFPSVSNDGNLITFISDSGLDPSKVVDDASRNLEIYVADLSQQGAERFRQITDSQLGISNEEPQISGDGRWVVYSSNKDGNREVYLYSVAGKTGKAITQTAVGNNSNAVINSDGSVIALTSDQALGGGTVLSGAQVFLARPAQPGTFQQISSAGANTQPAINRNGNRIVYVRTNANQNNIILYDVGVGVERQISSNIADRVRSNPTISRSGTVIAYEDNSSIAVANCAIADLALTVNAPPTVVAGESTTYRWQVTNQGTSVATNVDLRATLPSGFTLGAVSPAGGCTQTEQTVVCPIAELGIHETRAFTLPVAVTADLSGGRNFSVVTSSASVSDPVPANNTRAISTTIMPRAELSVRFDSVIPDTALETEEMTYTLSIHNAGPSVARAVVLSHTLPAELFYIRSDRAACVGSANGNVLACHLGTVPPGQRLTTQIVARVAQPTEKRVETTAQVSSSTLDPTLANNNATQSNSINTTFDLTVGLRLGKSLVAAGSSITHTLIITNLGPSTADSIVVTNTLPVQVTAKVDGNGRPMGACSRAPCTFGVVNSGSFTVALGTLPRNGVVEIAVSGIISPAYSGSITYQAAVRSAGELNADRNSSNNSASRSATVIRSAEMGILGIQRIGTPVAGTVITYVVTAINAGPSLASGVQLSQTLPVSTELQADGLTSNLGSCTATTPVVCTLGNLRPNTTLVVTMPVRIDPALIGTLVTTATVASETIDSLLSDNTSCPQCRR